MAGLKEIRRRVKSVNNTKKITYAMKLVSAAKLRKTQEAVTRSRAYTDALKGVLAQLQTGSEFSHPLLEHRDQVKKIRLLVIGGARGLCGGFNTNINRQVEGFYREMAAKNPSAKISATILGKKPAEHFRRVAREYQTSIENLPEDPTLWPTDDVCRQLEVEFLRGDIDELYLVYTKFRSVISLKVTLERLFPLDKENLGSTTSGNQNVSGVVQGNTLFEPTAQEVFDAVVPRIVRAIVRQAALDTKASEHASRMTAMDNATKNASELIHALTLKRNKLRQTGITNQLLDIVGGAEALN
jgi:F-type H+-transporting ATPase subunit gamma